MGFWDKVLPGYRGYREREECRNTDRLLREYLAGRLRRARDQWEEAKATLGRQPNALELLGLVERGTPLLGRSIERLAHANYGISGNWFGPKVDSKLLERLHDFDEQLADQVAQIEGAVAALAEARVDELGRTAEALRGRLAELESKLDERETILRTLDGAALDR